MRPFKSNENTHKKEDGSYYVVSASNPPDFKFYLGKLTNIFSPYSVMLNSLCIIVLFNAVKTDTKLTLHRMGKYFII